ncbi:MAG: hypothetical protein GYB66_03095, partial [Chloroflexi bacterium]|nr:hypothetical protein [Chloroflexota bacterium]
IMVFFASVILIIASLFVHTPGFSQTDEELERIDQAMQHLSGYLGRTITRNSHQWRWSEIIYPDTSLDCPLPGAEYAQQQTRGYQVRIFVDGLEYDYRLNADGTVVILCVDGRPDPTSIGVDIPEQAPTVEDFADFDVVNLTPSNWWAWAYVLDTDTLYLLDAIGEQARLPRPRLPNESPEATPKLGFSRDGQYIVIASELNSGVSGVGFYAIETGAFTRVHTVSPGETPYLGFGYDNSNITGSPFIVDPSGRFVAIGLANTDFNNPSWRVIVFELASGNALYQIGNANPQLGVLGEALNSAAIVFPRVVYFDEGVVHVQLIPFAAGAAEAYPAFAWHPNANFVEVSPFTHNYIDILPTTNTAVFAQVDEGTPRLDTTGPLIAYNTIAIGSSGAPQAILQNGNYIHTATRWADGGEQIIYKAIDGAGNETWNVLDRASGTQFSLENDVVAVYGIPEGFLTRTSEGGFTFHSDTGVPRNLWQAPEGTSSILAWASPAGSSFVPSVVLVPQNLTGIVHCPDTPVSNIAIGMRGQVTDITLRLRETPGGEFLVSMASGTEFLVVGGPECQGSYTWWRVRLENGTTGWAAEADESIYYIEPLPES